MIALIQNWIEGDSNLVQQIIGIFNNESDIPDFYKRTTYTKDELFNVKPKVKRFLNEKEYIEFEKNYDRFGYYYGHPIFYSIKTINIGEIINWIE